MSGFARAVAKWGSIKFWRDLALTVGAVLGVVCIVATIAIVAFDMKPLVFRSGSMSPAIDTGALAYAKGTPVGDLKPGDIVSVENSSETRITHRITAIEPNGSRAALTLKGDANEDADAVLYVVSSADRVLFSIPRAGYVVSWLSGPIGIFAGGLLVGLLSIVAFTPGRNRKRGGNKRDGALVAVLAVGLAGLGGVSPIRAVSTEAYFVNPAKAGNAILTAHTVPAPGSFTCVPGNGNTLDFSWTWPATPNPTSFIIQFTGGPVSITETGNLRVASSGNINNQSGTVSIVATKNYGSTIWTSVPSATTHSYSFGGGTKSCTPT